jgi:exosortase
MSGTTLGTRVTFAGPRHLGSLLVAVALAFLCWPVWRTWWVEWNDAHGYFVHGPVVPVLVAVVVWLRWATWASIPKRTRPIGFLVVAAGLYLLALGQWVSLYALGSLGVILVVPGVILALYGSRALRAALPVLGFLLFLVPMPTDVIEPVSFPLQMKSAVWASDLLRWAGLHVFRRGAVIDLPHYGMIVTHECSGLKLLVSLMMFAAFLGLIHVGAWWKKAVLLLCSLPLACAVNATRIAVSGILGECISARAGDRFHDCSGIYVWLMAILGFGLVVKLLRVRIWDCASRGDETGFPSRIGDPPSAQGRHWAFVAMVVVIAVGGLLTRQVAGKGLHEAPGGSRLTPSELPVTVGAWTSEAVVYPAETYEFYIGACIASRRYRRADGTVVDVMLVATHRREQVHTPVPCYECEGGVVRGSRSAELELDGRRVPVRRLWVQRGSTGRPRGPAPVADRYRGQSAPPPPTARRAQARLPKGAAPPPPPAPRLQNERR